MKPWQNNISDDTLCQYSGWPAWWEKGAHEPSQSESSRLDFRPIVRHGIPTTMELVKKKLLVYCLSSHTLAEIKWNWTPKSLLQVHPWIGQTWQSNEEMKVQWCRQGAWSHHVWLPNGIQELGFGYRTFENKSWLNKMRQEILKPSDTISFRKTVHSMPSISVWIFSRLFSIGIVSGGSPLARLT